MTEASAFPRLAAAIAEFGPRGAPGLPRYNVLQNHYATEVLPAILGGEWLRAYDVALGDLLPLSMVNRDLFDHPAVYRRTAARGAVRLNDAAIVAHPYEAMDEGGNVSAGAIAVTSSAAHLGLDVWIRRDLSVWYVGWTQLVVAAVGLPDHPGRWGFHRISPSAP